jgi:hypothetical protein
MATTLLFVHGRSQNSPKDIAGDPVRVAGYVAAKKRGWLAGLSRGLILAGAGPVGEDRVVFPFYADHFQQQIDAYEARGGRRPELELGGPTEQDERLAKARDAALLDAAGALGFDAARELAYADPAAAGALPPGSSGTELGWGDALRIPVVRSALQFVTRKTGVPATIIEQFLTDVAYYLEFAGMRDAVLDIVEDALRERHGNGGDLVVVGHSLGSVVAYDLLTRLPADFRVRLFVTAGSPLGYPIVQKNLLGKRAGHRPTVPDCLPERRGAWLNAYDVRDFVSLIHPISGTYDTAPVADRIVDERTFNPSSPHSIADYLADPDVAGPIGRALQTA